jgi:hypothetical protein
MCHRTSYEFQVAVDALSGLPSLGGSHITAAALIIRWHAADQHGFLSCSKLEMDGTCKFTTPFRVTANIKFDHNGTAAKRLLELILEDGQSRRKGKKVRLAEFTVDLGEAILVSPWKKVTEQNVPICRKVVRYKKTQIQLHLTIQAFASAGNKEIR